MWRRAEIRFPDAGEPAQNPRVQNVMRTGVPVAHPRLPVGEAIELLRAGSHAVVPVVNVALASSPTSAGRSWGAPSSFVGWVGETEMARALLAADSDAARKALMQTALADVPGLITPAQNAAFISPGAFVSDAARQMDASGANVLAVVDGTGAFLGLIGRGDLVRELTRPLRPPVLGGMATPLGVYLTTGAVSGGVGTLALMLTGLVMFAAFLLSIVLTQPILHWTHENAPPFLARASESGLAVVFVSLLQTALYLAFVRVSPLGGYHAAEHQTVHAIERSFPLLPQYVRAMPRVHPRCGTNLVAGGLLLTTTASLLQAVADALGWGQNELTGYAVWGFAAFIAWGYFRPVGSWLQQFVTTRPPSHKETESGIKAAREVLARHDARVRSGQAAAPPYVRLWRMGFLQIFAGFWVGLALVWLAGWCFPALRAASMPYLHDLML